MNGTMTARLDERLNPIVVRELRQAVRGRYVVGTLMSFLFILLFVAGFFLVQVSITQTVNSAPDLTMGRSMFFTLLGFLTFICMFSVPLYAGGRLGMEVQAGNTDLLFVTTLKPRSIILGKITAAVIITLQLFCVVMPFMTFSFVLRGIDLPTMFVVMGLAFIIVCVAIHGAVFIACLPASRPFKIALALPAFGQLFTLTMMVMAFAEELTSEGVGSMLTSWDFWAGALIFLSVTAAAMSMMTVSSVAMIAPKATNRILPVRILATIIWFVLGAIVVEESLRQSDEDIMYIWLALSVIALCSAIILSCSERTEPGVRVAKEIPRNRLLRLLVFPFFTGAANGLIWALILLVITCTVTDVVMHVPKLGPTYFELAPWGRAIVYTFVYAMTAESLRRVLLSRWVRPMYNWIITVLLIAVGTIIPSTIGLFMAANEVVAYSRWQFLSLFAVGDPLRPYWHDWILLAWAGAVMIVNARWFMRQARAFRPFEDAPAQ